MIRQRKPIARTRKPRPLSHLHALKPPQVQRKRQPKGPRMVHVILDVGGLVDVIESTCQKGGRCSRIDRVHLTAAYASQELRKRIYERAGGWLAHKEYDGRGQSIYVTSVEATCECGCGRPVSWESGNMHEQVPRGTTGGGSHESGKMSFTNSIFVRGGPGECHDAAHAERNPRLKWLKEAV